jgi:hypothetical protein
MAALARCWLPFVHDVKKAGCQRIIASPEVASEIYLVST